MSDVPNVDAARKALLALAERCENADQNYDPVLCSDLHDVLGEQKCVQPPNYNVSLDAAMKLLPNEFWMISNQDGGPVASILGDDDVFVDCKAVTPALAICAAALRARAIL